MGGDIQLFGGHALTPDLSVLKNAYRTGQMPPGTAQMHPGVVLRGAQARRGVHKSACLDAGVVNPIAPSEHHG